MEKIVSIGEQDCSVNLDGTECAVIFSSNYKCFTVQNDTSDDIYISINPIITAGKDGVRRVRSGVCSTLAHMRNNIDTVYILGTGTVQVVASDEPGYFFKSAPANGGGDNRFYFFNNWKKINNFGGYGLAGLVGLYNNSFFIRGFYNFQHIYSKDDNGYPKGNYTKIGMSIAADEFYYRNFSSDYVERKYVKLMLLTQKFDSSKMLKSVSLDGGTANNQIDSQYILASAYAPIENVLAYNDINYAYYSGTFYLDIPDVVETLFIDIETAALNVKIHSLWLE